MPEKEKKDEKKSVTCPECGGDVSPEQIEDCPKCHIDVGEVLHEIRIRRAVRKFEEAEETEKKKSKPARNPFDPSTW